MQRGGWGSEGSGFRIQGSGGRGQLKGGCFGMALPFPEASIPATGVRSLPTVCGPRSLVPPSYPTWYNACNSLDTSITGYQEVMTDHDHLTTYSKNC